MGEDINREAIFERLKHSVQALALSSHEQLELLPDFVVKTDELVLDFDLWCECALKNYGPELTTKQADSLRAIENRIQRASDNELSAWSDEALATHSFWAELRSLATQALGLFDWPSERPPSHSDEYVTDKTRQD